MAVIRAATVPVVERQQEPKKTKARKRKWMKGASAKREEALGAGS